MRQHGRPAHRNQEERKPILHRLFAGPDAPEPVLQRAPLKIGSKMWSQQNLWKHNMVLKCGDVHPNLGQTMQGHFGIATLKIGGHGVSEMGYFG